MLPAQSPWIERRSRPSSGRPQVAGERFFGLGTRSVAWRCTALSREEVEMSLATCTPIEVYPEGHRPLPDCLALT